MPDIATLSFSIDSSQARSAIAALVALKDASVNVAQAAQQQQTTTDRLFQSYSTARDQIDRLAQATKSYDGTLQGLTARITATREAMNGSQTAFSAYNKLVTEAAGVGITFNTTVDALDRYASKARELHIQQTDLTTGLNNITAALRNQTVAGNEARIALEQLGVSLTGLSPNQPQRVLQQITDQLHGVQGNQYTLRAAQQIFGQGFDANALQSLQAQPYIPYRQRQQTETAEQLKAEIDATTQAVQLRSDAGQRQTDETAALGSRFSQDPTVAGRLGLNFISGIERLFTQSRPDRLKALKDIEALPPDKQADYTGYGAQIGDFFNTGYGGQTYNQLFSGTYSSRLRDINQRYEDERNTGTDYLTANLNYSGRYLQNLPFIQTYKPLAAEDTRKVTEFQTLAQRREAAEVLGTLGDNAPQNLILSQEQLRRTNTDANRERYVGLYGLDEGTRRFTNQIASKQQEVTYQQRPEQELTDADRRQRLINALPFEQRAEATALLQNIGGTAGSAATATLTPGTSLEALRNNISLTTSQNQAGQQHFQQGVGTQLQQSSEETERQIDFQHRLTDALSGGRAAAEDYNRAWSAYIEALKIGASPEQAQAQALGALNTAIAQRITQGKALVQQLKDENDQRQAQIDLARTNANADPVTRRVQELTLGVTQNLESQIRAGTLPNTSGQFTAPDGTVVRASVPPAAAAALVAQSREQQFREIGQQGVQAAQGVRTQTNEAVRDQAQILAIMHEQNVSLGRATEIYRTHQQFFDAAAKAAADRAGQSKAQVESAEQETQALQRQLDILKNIADLMDKTREAAIGTAEQQTEQLLPRYLRPLARQGFGAISEAGQIGSGAPPALDQAGLQRAVSLSERLQTDLGFTPAGGAAAGALAGAESGVQPINEDPRTVRPGTRGGFGFFQWTGSRRQDMEAWAQARGLDPKDPETNVQYFEADIQRPQYRQMLGQLRTPGLSAEQQTAILAPYTAGQDPRLLAQTPGRQALAGRVFAAAAGHSPDVTPAAVSGTPAAAIPGVSGALPSAATAPAPASPSAATAQMADLVIYATNVVIQTSGLQSAPASTTQPPATHPPAPSTTPAVAAPAAVPGVTGALPGPAAQPPATHPPTPSTAPAVAAPALAPAVPGVTGVLPTAATEPPAAPSTSPRSLEGQSAPPVFHAAGSDIPVAAGTAFPPAPATTPGIIGIRGEPVFQGAARDAPVVFREAAPAAAVPGVTGALPGPAGAPDAPSTAQQSVAGNVALPTTTQPLAAHATPAATAPVPPGTAATVPGVTGALPTGATPTTDAGGAPVFRSAAAAPPPGAPSTMPRSVEGEPAPGAPHGVLQPPITAQPPASISQPPASAPAAPAPAGTTPATVDVEALKRLLNPQQLAAAQIAISQGREPDLSFLHLQPAQETALIGLLKQQNQQNIETQRLQVQQSGETTQQQVQVERQRQQLAGQPGQQRLIVPPNLDVLPQFQQQDVQQRRSVIVAGLQTQAVETIKAGDQALDDQRRRLEALQGPLDGYAARLRAVTAALQAEAEKRQNPYLDVELRKRQLLTEAIQQQQVALETQNKALANNNEVSERLNAAGPFASSSQQRRIVAETQLQQYARENPDLVGTPQFDQHVAEINRQQTLADQTEGMRNLRDAAHETYGAVEHALSAVVVHGERGKDALHELGTAMKEIFLREAVFKPFEKLADMALGSIFGSGEQAIPGSTINPVPGASNDNTPSGGGLLARLFGTGGTSTPAAATAPAATGVLTAATGVVTGSTSLVDPTMNALRVLVVNGMAGLASAAAPISEALSGGSSSGGGGGGAGSGAGSAGAMPADAAGTSGGLNGGNDLVNPDGSVVVPPIPPGASPAPLSIEQMQEIIQKEHDAHEQALQSGGPIPPGAGLPMPLPNQSSGGLPTRETGASSIGRPSGGLTSSEIRQFSSQWQDLPAGSTPSAVPSFNAFTTAAIGQGDAAQSDNALNQSDLTTTDLQHFPTGFIVPPIPPAFEQAASAPGDQAALTGYSPTTGASSAVPPPPEFTPDTTSGYVDSGRFDVPQPANDTASPTGANDNSQQDWANAIGAVGEIGNSVLGLMQHPAAGGPGGHHLPIDTSLNAMRVVMVGGGGGSGSPGGGGPVGALISGVDKLIGSATGGGGSSSGGGSLTGAVFPGVNQLISSLSGSGESSAGSAGGSSSSAGAGSTSAGPSLLARSVDGLFGKGTFQGSALDYLFGGSGSSSGSGSSRPGGTGAGSSNSGGLFGQIGSLLKNYPENLIDSVFGKGFYQAGGLIGQLFGTPAKGTDGGFNRGLDLLNPDGSVVTPPIPPGAIENAGGTTSPGGDGSAGSGGDTIKLFGSQSSDPTSNNLFPKDFGQDSGAIQGGSVPGSTDSAGSGFNPLSSLSSGIGSLFKGSSGLFGDGVTETAVDTGLADASGGAFDAGGLVTGGTGEGFVDTGAFDVGGGLGDAASGLGDAASGIGDAASSLGDIAAFAFAKGGVFTSGRAFAMGGVPANDDIGMHPPLSDFSSQVVEQPTYFRFARGAAIRRFANGSQMGLMGEAGAEAILPLSRGADGKLGVAHHGSASGNNGNTITFNISTPNADSFRRSQPQISARAVAAMSRTTQRNATR